MGAEGKFDLKLAPSYEASLGSASSPPSASSRSMFTSPKSGMNELFLAGFFAILASFWHFLATFVFHLQDKKMFYHFGWFLKLSASFWQLLVVFYLFYCFHNILVLLDHLWQFTKIFAILMAHPFQILWPPQKLQTLQKPQRFQPPEKPHLPPVFQKLLQMVSLNHGITYYLNPQFFCGPNSNPSPN